MGREKWKVESGAVDSRDVWVGDRWSHRRRLADGGDTRRRPVVADERGRERERSLEREGGGWGLWVLKPNFAPILNIISPFSFFLVAQLSNAARF